MNLPTRRRDSLIDAGGANLLVERRRIKCARRLIPGDDDSSPGGRAGSVAVWPWEHLAFGYLCYSAYTHARHGRAPDDGPTLALAVGTQFPDLVDKPLAWSLSLLPSGQSLAHSVFSFLPLVALVLIVTRRFGVAGYGVAFAVGYLSHLPADALYPLAFGDDPNVGALLWPVVPTAGYETAGFVPYAAELFAEFLAYLDTPRGVLYVLAEGGFLLSAVVLWVADGTPGLSVGRGEGDSEHV